MEKYIEIISNLNFSNDIWKITAPLIFSLADIITGFIQAVINKNVDSQRMRNGLLHKVTLIIIIILGFVLDLAFNLNVFSKTFCVIIIWMEIISISENIKKMGFKLGWLTKILKEKNDSTVNENLSYLISTIDDTIKDENKKEEGGTKDEKRN